MVFLSLLNLKKAHLSLQQVFLSKVFFQKSLKMFRWCQADSSLRLYADLMSDFQGCVDGLFYSNPLLLSS